MHSQYCTYLLKRNPRRSGPVQFEAVLFKGQVRGHGFGGQTALVQILPPTSVVKMKVTTGKRPVQNDTS